MSIRNAVSLSMALMISAASLISAASVQTFTLSASVSFAAGSPPPIPDNLIPHIAHTGLERISPISKYAVFKGTVTAVNKLSSLSVNYFIDNDVNTTTVTLPSSGLSGSTFNRRVKLSFKSASKLSYRITAIDNSGYTGNWPKDGSYFEVKITPIVSGSVNSSGGILILDDGNPDDGETSINMPSGALDSATGVSIDELDPLDASIPPGNSPAISETPVSVFRIEPSGTAFKKPVRLSLLYPDVDKDGLVDGTSYGDSTLRVMWWDGFVWRVQGTTLDTNNNLAVSNIKHLSLYAVFPVGNLSDDDYRPKEKIITPATPDNKNDFAAFGALGPADIVNIFNVNGHRIRQLKNDSIWDGKDEDGKIVESGIYIYQIKLADKIVSGTIVVAK